MTKSKYINNILEELSYRVDNGIPNFSNKEHLSILIQILKENQWSNSAIQMIVRNLWLVANNEEK